MGREMRWAELEPAWNTSAFPSLPFEVLDFAAMQLCGPVTSVFPKDPTRGLMLCPHSLAILNIFEEEAPQIT